MHPIGTLELSHSSLPTWHLYPARLQQQPKKYQKQKREEYLDDFASWLGWCQTNHSNG
jgi:hypothetical protein